MRSVLASRSRNYLFLIPLFALVLAYEAAYSLAIINDRLHQTTLVNAPFQVTPGTGAVTLATDTAKKAGLKDGERVLQIDGHSISGARDLAKSILSHHPHDIAVLTVAATDGQVRTIVLPLEPRSKDPVPWAAWVFVAVLFAVLLFCTLAGIYAAAVLPNDRRALIVFGLLFAVAQIVNSASWADFPPLLWLPAMVVPYLGGINLAIFLVLFGLYFPERFAWDLQRPWLKWLVLAPIAILNLLTILVIGASYFDFRALPRLTNFLNNPYVNSGSCSGLLIMSFFFCIAAKLRTAKAVDSRRRLRILITGSAVSFMPLLGLVLYQVLHKGKSPSEDVIIPIVLIFFLFPVTLVYVIVAERAMNLRMVIRQGLRYTLARGGMRLLLALMAAAVIIPVNTFLLGSRIDDALKIVISIVVCVGFVIFIRRVRNRLMNWVDQRFFREAYNAQTLLEELSDHVRSIVDERELLETVGKRISESLHVPHFSFLRASDDAYHPVYCLGFEPTSSASLPKQSKTVELVSQSKTAAQIYFDRQDNWVHTLPESELVTLKGVHAQLLLPVGTKQNLLGILSLGPKLSEEPYSSSDVQLLRSVAAQTGLALENSRLTKAVASEMAQRERLNREIEIAREVQERLFPQRLPVMAGIDFCGACRPALGVGGDYYDFLELPNGDLGVAVGDVSGKGIAAALLMASLQASLRGQVLSGQGNLARLMTNVNQLVYEATPANRYATFFYGQFERATLTFRYVNAGHNPPMILRYAGDVAHVIRLETGGPVVGLFPKAPYQEGVVALEPGDIFVGFTDGISEAMNAADEEWGEERLIPAVAANAARSSADMIPQLMAAADLFVAGAPQHDDMTLVILKLSAV